MGRKKYLNKTQNIQGERNWKTPKLAARTGKGDYSFRTFFSQMVSKEEKQLELQGGAGDKTRLMIKGENNVGK